MSKRLARSKSNVVSGILGQAIKILSKFSIRTVMIYYFGAAYLGLDGLFMNVISVLSLAEMGIGDAVCYALYEPLAKKNNQEICSYLRLYKKVYIYIGLVVLAIGNALVPFLKYLVNFESDININYLMIYYLFLINSVLTYFFGAYRQVILIADQQMSIINNVNNVQIIFQSIVQLYVLIQFKNYYIYLLIMVLANLLKNIYLYYVVGKRYPAISDKKIHELANDKKTALVKNIYALAVTKISTIIYTSSDNLVISACVGTMIVGYYSNYSYIVVAVSGIISILFSSVVASIGNIYASDSAEHLHQVYKNVLFFNKWVYGFCFVCLWQLLSPFVLLWTGNEKYILSYAQVTFIGLMFLIPGLNHTCTIFRAACGLFWQTRYRTVATALINIISSIVLARMVGLIGVFVGTIASYLLTTFLVDPKVIYKEVFKEKAKEFYIWYVISLIEILVIGIMINIICSFIKVNSWGTICVRLLICIIVYNGVFYLCNHNNASMHYFFTILKKKNV